MAAERDEHTAAAKTDCEPSTMHPETTERTMDQGNWISWLCFF